MSIPRDSGCEGSIARGRDQETKPTALLHIVLFDDRSTPRLMPLLGLTGTSYEIGALSCGSCAIQQLAGQAMQGKSTLPTR
jgi:hypothetical protein